ERASWHESLGILLRDLGRHGGPGGAEEHLQKALALRSKLADEFRNMAAYRRELANTQSNLGNLLRVLGRHGGRGGAEEHLQKALTLRQKLAQGFPAVPGYRQDLAASHNEMGTLLRALGRHGGPAGAEEQYRKALALRQKLADDFPDVHVYRGDLS